MQEESTVPTTPPAFLVWADEEVARLHDKARHEGVREIRFRIENEVATIEAAATLFRRWLSANGFTEDAVQAP